jgi:hypothetical protein
MVDSATPMASYFSDLSRCSIRSASSTGENCLTRVLWCGLTTDAPSLSMTFNWEDQYYAAHTDLNHLLNTKYSLDPGRHGLGFASAETGRGSLKPRSRPCRAGSIRDTCILVDESVGQAKTAGFRRQYHADDTFAISSSARLSLKKIGSGL